MKYKVSSLWSGKYSKTYNGMTDNLLTAIWWWISWSILEFFKVLKNNKYHYGNIFCIGERLSDKYGSKPNTKKLIDFLINESEIHYNNHVL